MELYVARGRVGAVLGLLCVVTVLAGAGRCLAGLIVPGDLYTSNEGSRVIEQYAASGVKVASYTLPSSDGSEVRGMVEGPDGLLYAVTVTNSGFNVVSINNSGTVTHKYSGSEYVEGSGDDGEIAFANDGDFFVAAADDLIRFSVGSSNGTVIYSTNQVFDVAPLPSGDLLVLSAYQLQELTTSGTIVRSIYPTVGLGDARGVAYDAATDTIYVTMLGYTNEQYQILKIDGTTGQVENQATYTYADDVFLTANDELLVGSGSLVPALFDLNLNKIGTLNGGPQEFVTQATVPEPSSVWLLGFGVAGIVGYGLHRRWRIRCRP